MSCTGSQVSPKDKSHIYIRMSSSHRNRQAHRKAHRIAKRNSEKKKKNFFSGRNAKKSRRRAMKNFSIQSGKWQMANGKMDVIGISIFLFMDGGWNK